MIRFLIKYPGRESNPHVLGHTPLKRARLPIPPPGCTYGRLQI